MISFDFMKLFYLTPYLKYLNLRKEMSMTTFVYNMQQRDSK
jgi:hypothetical protein